MYSTYMEGLLPGAKYDQQLVKGCRTAVEVLRRNDMGDFTVPHPELFKDKLYRGWDSPLTAVGWLQLDPQRAALELTSHPEVQRPDGLLPNSAWLGRYENRLLPAAEYLLHLTHLTHRKNYPSGVRTSGVSQPLLHADVALLIGEKLPTEDRIGFYRQIQPQLERAHAWVYRDRDMGHDGLWAAVHPFETGMDNTPPWMEHMRSLDWGLSGRIAGSAVRHLNWLRRDIQQVNTSERSLREETVVQMQAQFSLIKNRYQAERLRDRHPLHVQDVLLNSVLISANRRLRTMAAESGRPLSDELLINMGRTEANFEKLWNPATGHYQARDAISGRYLGPPTITSLIALYSGVVPSERAEQLVDQCVEQGFLGNEFGIPTVSPDDKLYRPDGYWSGSVWPPTSWIAINGLLRSGFIGHAKQETATLIRNMSGSKMNEYSNSCTGRGAGIAGLGMSAGIYLDLANNA